MDSETTTCPHCQATGTMEEKDGAMICSACGKDAAETMETTPTEEGMM